MPETGPRLRVRDLVRGPFLGLWLPWLAGRAVMLAAGAPPRLLLLDTGALVLGLLLALVATRPIAGGVLRVPGSVAMACLAIVALSLLGEPMDEVRRWIALGPLRLHTSAIVSPLLLAAMASLGRAGRYAHVLLVVALAGTLHALQPDAGQATALGLGAGVVVLGWVRGTNDDGPRPWGAVGLGVSLVLASAALAWSRPDPLAPVRFVEQIVAVAFALGPVAGALTVVCLVVLPVAAWRSRHPDAAVLAAYFAGSIVVTWMGAFPVPVVGHGASPILGTALGLALLCHDADPSEDGDGAVEP